MCVCVCVRPTGVGRDERVVLSEGFQGVSDLDESQMWWEVGCDAARQGARWIGVRLSVSGGGSVLVGLAH